MSAEAGLRLLQVHGGGKLQLRSTDSRFLAFVDSWWSALLPRIAPYLHKNGGPILMIQASPSLLLPHFPARMCDSLWRSG